MNKWMDDLRLELQHWSCHGETVTIQKQIYTMLISMNVYTYAKVLHDIVRKLCNYIDASSIVG